MQRRLITAADYSSRDSAPIGNEITFAEQLKSHINKKPPNLVGKRWANTYCIKGQFRGKMLHLIAYVIQYEAPRNGLKPSFFQLYS